MYCIRYSLFFILLLLIFHSASAITIHGIVYEWSTFEPLDNALVEVNSTPVQFRVASSGVYSFNLPAGDYLIKTSYYENNTLTYYSEDNITVSEQEGDFVFDILLFPVEEEEDVFSNDDIGNVSFDIEESAVPKFDWTYSVLALLVLIITATAAYYHYRGRENMEKETAPFEEYVEEIEEPIPSESAALPDDLKEIIGILQKADGRITQKDLRKNLNCSEAKVSLMVADLEARGWVQKIKKGRGNIILLIKKDDL